MVKSPVHALKMERQHIQFAPDLLPADVAGSEAQHQITGSKDFPLLAALGAGAASET